MRLRLTVEIARIAATAAVTFVAFAKTPAILARRATINSINLVVNRSVDFAATIAVDRAPEQRPSRPAVGKQTHTQKYYTISTSS